MLSDANRLGVRDLLGQSFAKDRPGDDPILKTVKDSARAPIVPRARGTASLQVKARGGESAIRKLQTSGCMKLLFPRCELGIEAITLNTAGGLTGGDRIQAEYAVEEGAHLTITTQSAERLYRAQSGYAGVETNLTVAPGGSMFWMPQELILFEGSALRRKLNVELGDAARLIVVEPVIFGRLDMGERITSGLLDDRVRITRNGHPIYADAIHMSGDLDAQLARPAVADRKHAMATLLYHAPDALARADAVRDLLPQTAAVSKMDETFLTLRIVASDGFELRKTLLPVLDLLSQQTLPISWRL